MAAPPCAAPTCGLLLAAFVLLLLWRALSPAAVPAHLSPTTATSPPLRDLVNDAVVGLGLQAHPPPCTPTSSSATYMFSRRQVEVLQGQPLSVLLTGGVLRGGAILRVEMSSDTVSLTTDCRDLRDGRYRVDFPPLFVPPGEYTAVAYEMFACSRSLFDYHCDLLLGPPMAQCAAGTMQGQDPGLSLPAAHRKVDIMQIRVRTSPAATQHLIRTAVSRSASADLQASAYAPARCSHSRPPCQLQPHAPHLPGHWQRRPSGDPVPFPFADFYPAHCTVMPVAVRQCLQAQFLVFIGDSTLRNLYLMTGARYGSGRTRLAPDALRNLSAAWPPDHPWPRHGNALFDVVPNPVYFSWVSDTTHRAPTLPDILAAAERWQRHLGQAQKPTTVMWLWGAHSPGMNVSTAGAEAFRYASQFRQWQRAGGLGRRRVFHVATKAVRDATKTLTKVWNNVRIAAKNAVIARVVSEVASIPTIDLFHPSLGITAWPVHFRDNIHLVKWVNAVLADILLHFVCADHHITGPSNACGH
eukprot:GGOE01037363.1.p1 GENE.GGOE01037363.1~~GGOE01037363.1.p1  ORF type:complete len:526 (+),score=109.70 GGOE01037363.1:84-1661(+)